MQCLWGAVCPRNTLRKAGLFVDYIDEHVVFVPKTPCSRLVARAQVCDCLSVIRMAWGAKMRVALQDGAALRWLVVDVCVPSGAILHASSCRVVGVGLS